MKFLLKILFIAIFLLNLNLLKLSVVHADKDGVECDGNASNASVVKSDTTDEAIVIAVKVKDYDPSSGAEGWTFRDDRGGEIITDNDGFTIFDDDFAWITFTIPVSGGKFSADLAKKIDKEDEILFWVEDKNGDDCNLYLDTDQFKEAMSDALLGTTYTTPGNGGTTTATIGTSSITSPSCPDPSELNTALGCIPTSPRALTEWILLRAISIGGGIAFLLSLFGGISIILAGGDPEKINQGKQIITSAISGLLFILFSILLLRLIGYDILALPGFTN